MQRNQFVLLHCSSLYVMQTTVFDTIQLYLI